MHSASPARVRSTAVSHQICHVLLTEWLMKEHCDAWVIHAWRRHDSNRGARTRHLLSAQGVDSTPGRLTRDVYFTAISSCSTLYWEENRKPRLESHLRRVGLNTTECVNFSGKIWKFLYGFTHYARCVTFFWLNFDDWKTETCKVSFQNKIIWYIGASSWF